MITVKLKAGRDKPVRAGHPWVFSGAVARVDGESEPGNLCRVEASDGRLLGTGFYNIHSSIRIRMLSRESLVEPVLLVAQRIADAWKARQEFIDTNTDSYRIVNAEGDMLPGLIVDKYGKGLCVQFQTAGMDRLRTEIIAALQHLCKPDFIFDVSDKEYRRREGLSPSQGPLVGAVPDEQAIQENGLRYLVSVGSGQKTGFYCDQRDNRRAVARFAAGADVLDCFCYTGGFSMNALAAGARTITAVDSSVVAADTVGRNAALNGFVPPGVVCEDVFSFLRKSTGMFGCIILDPPKFARTAGDVEKAARGYKDINLLAIRRVLAGGILATFSCSQAVDSKLFRQIVFAAAADSGRDVQIVSILGQPADHPVHIAHREGEYLKGLIVRVC